jgi:hypothetical protein
MAPLPLVVIVVALKYKRSVTEASAHDFSKRAR